MVSYNADHNVDTDALAEVICLVPSSWYCVNVPLLISRSAVASPAITVAGATVRNALYKPISTLGTSAGSFSTTSSVRVSIGLGSSVSLHPLTKRARLRVVKNMAYDLFILMWRKVHGKGAHLG